MAKDRIESKDVLDPKLKTDIIGFNKELSESVRLMTDATKSAINLSNAFNPKTVQDVTKSVEQYNTQNLKSQKIAKDGINKLTSLQKERMRIAEQRKKVLAKTLSLEEKGTKTLIKGQEIAQKKAREEAQKSLGVSKKQNGLFKSMAKGMIAAGAAALSLRAAFNLFKNSIKTIASFEEAMSKVRAVTGALPKDFKALQDNAMRLGSTTSKTASEISGLQLSFAKLGFSTKEILAATEATIQLSIAAGSDLAGSATVAASTIRGFGKNAGETQQIVDVMAKSFATTGLDLEKFKTAMANAQVAAKATNKTFEQTTAMLGTIVDTGTDASKAGTDLRVIFGKLAKKGIDLEDAYEKVNNSSNKVVTAMGLVGDRAFSSLITLAENRDKTDELTKAYENAGGAAAEMARVMEDNLIGDTKKLSSAWEGFILGLNSGGGVITNVFRGLTQWLTNVVGNFNLMNKTYSELIQGVADEQLADNIKEDAKEVNFLSDKLSETMGYDMIEDSGRGYRRVVPSPLPIDVKEKAVIKSLLDAKHIVITVGGGGIPVVIKGNNLEGVAAVIDKDNASAKLAELIDADILVILTAVDNVYINFGKPNAEALGEVSINRLEQLIEEKHFAEGSMLPKINATMAFAKNNKISVIASLNNAEEAFNLKAGTIIRG